MITRSRKLIYYSVAAIFFLAIISGCADSRSAIREDSATGTANGGAAVIQSIKVSSDATQVEIQTDKPLSYTYYKTTEPPKVVIDIAQAVPGAIAKTLEVSAGNIKRIDVEKHEFTGGFLSRIEIIPVNELGDFSVATDPADKGKLLITFKKPQLEEKTAAAPMEGSKPVAAPDAQTSMKETQPQAGTAVAKEDANKPGTVPPAISAAQQATLATPASVSETKPEEKPSLVETVKETKQTEPNPVPTLQPRVLSAVAAGGDGIEITVNGGIDTFTAFKLNKPDRIVLDLPGIKNGIAARSIILNKFGVGKARLGNYPGKVRIVLEAAKGTLLSYQVAKSANGLNVMFGEASVKPLEKAEKGLAKESAVPSSVQTVAAASSTTEPQTAAASPAKVLNGVTASDEGIDISVSGGIDTFNAFKLTKPDRIVLDLPGVKGSVAAKPVSINKFGVGQARVGSYPDKLRIVLDAAKDVIPSYHVVKGENGLKVLFADASVKPAEKAENVPGKESAGPATETKKAVQSGTSALEAIDFSVAGEYSRIALKLGAECNAGKIAHVAGGLALTIRNCKVPANLQRTIDTSAFPTAVEKIIPYQVRVKKGNEARILIKLRQKVTETFLKPEGDTLVWNIKNPENVNLPRVAARKTKEGAGEVEAPSAPAIAHKIKGENESAQGKPQVATLGDKKVYTGRRVSLEFSDADIRKILQLIAEVSNLNFLIGDDVTGTISIKLVNVPWDQALDVILETKGLEKRQDGNIMYIKPKGKFISEDQIEAEAKKDRERRMELKTRIFDINFASVDDISKQFDRIKSDRGIISVDSRTNRVIVKDIEDRIDEMAKLLKALDQSEKQVMIEARIVEASSTFTRDLGVQWGLHYQDGSASFLGINKVDLGMGGIVIPPPSTGTFSDTSATTTGGAAGISFGKLTSNIQLDLRLSAAASLGQIKVISTPKVITLNNKAAKISQGQSIPYQTTSAEGTKTEFVEAALTLEVTPHVANDGSISMKIKASNNSAGTGTPPPINKKEATTEVQVMNGETTVIGGIYQDNDTENDTGVPFLQDIPLLGWLFKSNTKSKTKTELLIFITPRVVS